MAFLIWSIVTIVFCIIGFYSRKSSKAVGFFSNVEPPEVEDVVNYNKAVSNIWFVAAVVFELLGLPLLKLEQNDPRALFIIVGTVFWVIGIIVAYLRVEQKYKKK